MLNFFLLKGKDTSNYPIKKYSKFDYIKTKYLFELDRVREYYFNRTRTVENKNIFSRLIYILQPNLNLSLFDYFRHVDQEKDYIARQFRLTNDISLGELFRNLLYKDNNYTAILTVDRQANVLTLGSSWKTLTPLRMVYTTSTDINFYQYDKSKYYPYSNLTILELDINEMLIQYRYWAKYRLERDLSTNPNVYVSQLLYPNLAATSLDINLFNRLKRIYYNQPMDNYNVFHPFFISDYTKGIDDIYNKVLDDVVNTGMALPQILKTIPCIYNNNMVDALTINKSIYTSRSGWLIWLSRLEYISFLIDVMGPRGVTRNRQYLYVLPNLVKKMNIANRQLIRLLPEELYIDYTNYITSIGDRIGKR